MGPSPHIAPPGGAISNPPLCGWYLISYLAMSVCSLVEIAQILGHRSIQTTQRYAHLWTEHQRNLTDRVLGNLE